jgi:CBS domain-containing protein
MSTETTVKDILSAKSLKGIRVIGPHDLVFDALKEMARENIGALLVMDKDKVVGIVSERDYARKVALKNMDSRTTKVADIMERKVYYVVPDDSAEGCMALMTSKRIRHLPVIESGELLGLVSIGDIVKAVMVDREFMIDQLICYATGSYSGKSEYLDNSKRQSTEERVL